MASPELPSVPADVLGNTGSVLFSNIFHPMQVQPSLSRGSSPNPPTHPPTQLPDWRGMGVEASASMFVPKGVLRATLCAQQIGWQRMLNLDQAASLIQRRFRHLCSPQGRAPTSPPTHLPNCRTVCPPINPPTDPSDRPPTHPATRLPAHPPTHQHGAPQGRCRQPAQRAAP